MRYSKGFIAISDERDVPVLLRIRNARAISFNQLCDLLALEEVETLRRSVHWRVSRLKAVGLIDRLDGDRYFGQPVFTITSVGLAVLESRGHSMVAMPSTAERVIHPSQALHALELVNIHLSLARNGLLLSWKTELEIASRNLVLEHRNAKDYDALAEIMVGDQVHTFAIEYERTVKAAARYQDIRELLGRDRTVNTVLYLTSNRDILYLLAVEMRGAAKQIGLALSDVFRRDLLNTNTLLVNGSHEVVPFCELFSQ